MGFPGGSEVKDPLDNQETQVWSLGWEDPLEKEMATHSSIFFLIFIYLAVPGLCCGMWDVVPCPGIKLRLPALGPQCPTHWTI